MAEMPSLIYSARSTVSGGKRRRMKRLPRTHRSLAVLIESLRSSRLIFELKNDTEMAGTVYDVDTNLNVNLVDAELTIRGRTKPLEEVYVNGSMIRYIRFPNNRDPLRALDTYLDTRSRIARSGTRAKRSALSRPPVPDPINLVGRRPQDDS